MKRLLIVYILLVALTLGSALVSQMQLAAAWLPVAIILALAGAKFVMVVLEYMEMKKANNVWKMGVIMPALVTALLIGIFALV